MELPKLAMCAAWLRRREERKAKEEKARREHENWLFNVLLVYINNSTERNKRMTVPAHPHGGARLPTDAELEKKAESQAQGH